MNAQEIGKKKWTVKHDDNDISFETLDAAIWYAAGAASVSNSIRQINTREKLITLLPVEPKHVQPKLFSPEQKCAA